MFGHMRFSIRQKFHTTINSAVGILYVITPVPAMQGLFLE